MTDTNRIAKDVWNRQQKHIDELLEKLSKTETRLADVQKEKQRLTSIAEARRKQGRTARKKYWDLEKKYQHLLKVNQRLREGEWSVLSDVLEEAGGKDG